MHAALGRAGDERHAPTTRSPRLRMSRLSHAFSLLALPRAARLFPTRGQILATRPPVRLSFSLPPHAPRPATPAAAAADSGSPQLPSPPPPPLTLVERACPAALLPFLRLARIERPVGTWLALLPGWWGLALAAPPGGLPNAELALLFGAGAFLVRGAGCTANDIWDRDFDAHVARTRLRPLAAGQVSLSRAAVFLALQLAAALLVLAQLDAATVQLGVLLAPLVCLYPLAKRVTSFAQVVLGLAMNFGVLMGATAAAAASAAATAAEPKAAKVSALRSHDRLVTTPAHLEDGGKAANQLPEVPAPRKGPFSGLIDALTTPRLIALSVFGTVPVPASIGLPVALLPSPSLLLFAGAVGWTVVYDTLYAHQDRRDDRRLGLRSTALWMGRTHTRPVLSAVAVASAGLWSLAGVGADLGWPFYAAVAGACTHMLWQSATADVDDARNLQRRFLSNTRVGWAMLAGIVVARRTQVVE